MLVVIVANCAEYDKKKRVAEFYYNGKFNGKAVTSIRANFIDKEVGTPEAGTEYIFHFKVNNNKSGVLNGDVKRLRSLDSAVKEFDK